MLNIDNANKYFNKGRKNQIHAIDNTSLKLNDNGLVCLLGPSGCGKTTLLNAIGGLDKLNKGNIYLNNTKITSKCTRRVDKVRNLHVGYIFQDYKLINNLSVYDNVSIVLKMIGIKDKNEINKRVEYVLDKVGMLRYKRRPANMLSGGEKQRVAIARAIVKDPEIILADEPTGNLDSKNSLEIMKILRNISKNRLVILVTHERNLADFYADRIIEIQDGKVINDKENTDVNELDYEIDNTFYLKDFESHKELKADDYNIDIYSNKKDKINVSLVVANGNIYIKSNSKVEVVDEESSIELVNDHYKKPTHEDIDKLTFNFQEIIDNNYKKKYSSIYSVFTYIIKGFNKILDFSFLKKILLVGFFLSGMFLTYAVSSMYAALEIKDKDFVMKNKEYINVTSKQLKVNDFLEYEKDETINYIIPGNSMVDFSLRYDDYYQSYGNIDHLTGSLSSVEMINNSDIIHGRMPENKYELVVDKQTIKNMFTETHNAQMVGIKEEKELIGRVVNVNNMEDFTIVGIVSKDSPSIYTDRSLFINILENTRESFDDEFPIHDYELYKDKIKIKKGRKPQNDYEIIVDISNKETMKLNKKINSKVNGVKLKVVGYYDSKDNYNDYFTTTNTMKYYVITKSSDMTIYSNNKEETLNKYKAKKINVEDSYTQSRKEYLRETKDYRNSSIITAAIILLISLIEIFLMTRSSFLSRIKEIGILRAIGVKKYDIYKMFFGEIISITTIASVPGILFAAYIINKLVTSDLLPSGYFSFNAFILIITIVFIYLFNMIVGLIPVFNTLRKTPASILSRYDLD